MAHEVRNPLNALSVLLEAFFLDMEGREELKPYKERIQQQIARLTKLMQDLLEMGRPADPSKYVDVDLVELCTSTVTAWKTSHPKSGTGITVRSDLREGALTVRGDRERLHGSIMNLLENAAFHSGSDGTIDIELSRSAGGAIRIAISDSGPGIAAEYLGRVFDPFFTTRKGGTGLGLGIVRNVIEAHGGTVSLQNRGGQRGAVAEIKLPPADSEG